MRIDPDAKLLETGPSPAGWHRLQTVIECPQKFAYHYKLHMDAGLPAAALLRGTMVHLALAHHYARKKNIDEGRDPDEFIPPQHALALKAYRESEYKDVFSQVLDVINAYIPYHEEMDKKWNVFATEKLMDVQIPDPDRNTSYRYTGRCDLMIEDPKDGGIYIVDYKTTARLTHNHKKWYAMSGQMIGYEYMGQLQYGDRIKGVMVWLIQVTPPFKFERYLMPPRPKLAESFPRTVIEAERRIAYLESLDMDPLDWPKAMTELTCFSRYGACGFIDNCKYGLVNTDLIFEF